MSYNPSYGDHQDLLQEVANKELMLIKEEKHLKRVTSRMFSRVTENEREVPIYVKLQIKESVIYRGIRYVTWCEIWLYFPVSIYLNLVIT
jgi:hypothetical protein